MAQLVEHNLAKVGVAGSSPVVRSIASLRPVERLVFFMLAAKSGFTEPVPSSSSL